jgi:YD repeat-containing protein
MEELQNGVPFAAYLNGPRRVEHRKDALGNIIWYLYDGLGSVIAEVDTGGNVTATRT